MLINFILIKSHEFIKFYKPKQQLENSFSCLALCVCVCLKHFKINQQLIYVDAASLSGALCGCCQRQSLSSRILWQPRPTTFRHSCLIYIECALLWCDYLGKQIHLNLDSALIKIFSHISISLLLRLAPAGMEWSGAAAALTIMKIE